MPVHFNITVKGKVHGVYYRATAMKIAAALGITGFAQNMSDGTVYMEIEGDEDMAVKFIHWCHHGPEDATVEHVSVSDGPLQSFSLFEIRR